MRKQRGGGCGGLPNRRPSWYQPLLRLQAIWARGRISYLLAIAGKYLPESHQVFSDSVRRNKGDKGVGKGNGKDGKGPSKGKFKPPQPKRAAAPANPQG